jgi:hypothetical protein
MVLAFKRLSVIHLRADATFQPIVVKDIQFRREPAVLFLQPLHFPVSGRLFIEIGFGDRLLEPLQDCWRDYEFLERSSKLVFDQVSGDDVRRQIQFIQKLFELPA